MCKMLSNACTTTIQGKTILNKIVMFINFNNLSINNNAMPFSLENLTIKLHFKEKDNPINILKLIFYYYNP